MNKNYDVILIGAGSVGVPTALELAKKKLSVLVIEKLSSVGQGQNKKAIGGIRATHSDYGKIKTSQRSIEIFSTWKDKYGDDIGWISNGYSFPAYNKTDAQSLKAMIKIQQNYGLNIKWISAAEYKNLVPGINSTNLIGSTYSENDGSASPLLAINSFYFKSKEYGARYHFNETVTNIERNNKSFRVLTNKNRYSCSTVINTAGNKAKEIGKMVNIELPVEPDSHEGGISEPVERFFGPMVVDMRPTENSANFYFYQNNEGQVIFCITPKPPYYGTDSDSTSWFLPKIAKRMVKLYPRLKNLKVRRTWRGQYPMTPDGFPIVGRIKESPNFINAVGMCGQGFMLGPGLGVLLTKIVLDELTEEDERILQSFSLYRDFSGQEKFK